jgi:hypothetical protein
LRIFGVTADSCIMKSGALWLSVSLVFAVISTSAARLGETEDECEERYGPPIQYAPSDPNVLVPGTQERWFLKSALYVRVLFRQGRAVCLFFERQRGFFTRDMEQALLEANASDEWVDQDINSDYWTKNFGPGAEMDSGPRTWHSASGDRIAHRVRSGGQRGLMIADMSFYKEAKDKLEYFHTKLIERWEKRREEQTQERMKGF